MTPSRQADHAVAHPVPGHRAINVLLARPLVVLLLACLVASCTAMRLGYDHADRLIVSSLDHYLDLTSSQEDLVRDRARELLTWHRTTQLADYQKLIATTSEKIQTKLTAADVLAFNEAVNQRFVRIGEQAAPDLAQLALTLSPAQIDRLERKLSDETTRAQREIAEAGPERSNVRRIRRFIERAEGWFGDLREDQLKLVRGSFAARPLGPHWPIEERIRRQADLIALLRRVQAQHPDVTTVTEWTRQYFARLVQPTDPDERAHVHQSRQDTAQLVASLVNSADSRQRAAISRRLASYAEDFRVLASERGAG
jgi:hypothetical protein